MAATVLLIICILGASIGFYLLVLTQLSLYYAMIIIVGGVPVLGGSVLQIPQAIKKVKGLLSHVRLGHLLWFSLFIISTSVFRARDAKQLAQNPVDLAASVRIVAVAVVGIIVFSTGLVTRKDIINKLFHGLPGLMFAYGLIGIASSIYSVFPTLSLYKACEIIVDVSMIAFFLSRYPSRTDMKRWIDFTWFMVALLITIIWVEAILFPNRAFRPTRLTTIIGFQLQGVMPYIHPNWVGVLAAILIIASLSRTLNARKQNARTVYIISLSVGVITLVLAQTRTSLFGVIIAVMAMLLLNKRIRLLGFVALLLILIIIFSDLPSLLLKYVIRGQTWELFFSFTGRMHWWRFGWEAFCESPIYGYGFGAGVRYVVFSSMGNFATATMHNSWLEVLVNVGILGLIPVVLAFLGTWRTLLRISFRPPSWFDRTMRMLSIEMIGLFIILSLDFITAGGSSFLHDREILLFLLVVAYAQQIKNWQKAHKVRRRINARSFSTYSLPIQRS